MSGDIRKMVGKHNWPKTSDFSPLSTDNVYLEQRSSIICRSLFGNKYYFPDLCFLFRTFIKPLLLQSHICLESTKANYRTKKQNGREYECKILVYLNVPRVIIRNSGTNSACTWVEKKGYNPNSKRPMTLTTIHNLYHEAITTHIINRTNDDELYGE